MEEKIIVISILALTPILPTYTAWKHPNKKGVILSALTLWIFFFLAWVFLLNIYGTGGPAGALAGLWMITGWLWSGIYCSIISAIRRAVKKK